MRKKLLDFMQGRFGIFVVYGSSFIGNVPGKSPSVWTGGGG